MLTKEKFSEEYTARSDYYDRENEFDFADVFIYTSSDDNLLPKSLKYFVSSKTSEWNKVGIWDKYLLILRFTNLAWFTRIIIITSLLVR